MKRAMQKLKVMIAAALCAAGIGVAQAEFISPGITVNGIKPTKDGSNSGFTYNNGVFTLNSAGATYTLAGQDTSGKVRVQVATYCTIELASGFKLDLSSKETTAGTPSAERSPISIPDGLEVTVRATGNAYLYGARLGAALRVEHGATVYIESGFSTGQLFAYGGKSGAGIGSGYNDDAGCGTIYLRGRVTAHGGGEACGIGHGNTGAWGGAVFVDSASAAVVAQGYYPAAAIGTSANSSGSMTIEIRAGTVHAYQFNGGGAAIGTGRGSTATCNISIFGGTVAAQGVADGSPGIGAGQGATGAVTINISGGKVTATGATGAAGIGGGNYAKTPTINITGGTVVAKGDSDSISTPDIGAGKNGTGSAKTVVTGGSVLLAGGKGDLYPSASSSTKLTLVTVGDLGVDKEVTVSSFGTYAGGTVKSDQDGNIYLWATPGNYNNITVDGTRYGADTSSGAATASLYVPHPPANDNFASAESISGMSGRLTGTTFDATKENDIKNTYGNPADQEGSVWYKWKAPASGSVRFIVQHTKPASGERVDVYAWKGTSRTGLEFPANANQGYYTEEDHGFWGKYVAFDAVKGATYMIYVAHCEYEGCDGPFSLAWDDGRWIAYLGKDGTAKIDGDYKFTFSGAITIPSTIFGCQVTELDEACLANQKNITSVTLPNGLKVIGERAFQNCPALKSAPIPASVMVIGDRAFDRCALTSLTIPESVVSIGECAFYGCEFTSVTVPYSVKSLAMGVFSGCDKLTSVTIPASVTSLGDRAFEGCESLESITIPASVTSLGNQVFSMCSALKTVTYLGDMPEVGVSIYWSDLVSVVPAGNSTWSAALAAGMWQGYPIRTDAVVPTTVKVTFNANGGSVSETSRTVDYGAVVGNLPEPTRSGWEFQGWWTDPSGGTQISSTTKVATDVTYYAHWKKLYTITFMANGGSPNMTMKAREGTPMFDWVLARWTPAREGYEFDGVWTAAEGGEKVTDAITVTSDMIFYAHWNLTSPPTTVTLTFDPNGGELDEAARKRVINQGDRLGRYGPLPTPTREGDWKFEGWWTKRDGGSMVNANWTPQVDATYYARWVKTIEGEVAEVVDGIKWYYAINREVGQDGNVQIFKAYGEPAAVRVDGTPISGTVMVPEKLGGVDVTVIGGDAFINCAEMRRVKLPDTVKEIRSSAFSGCSSLQVAALGKGLTKIWDSAFKDCTSLTAAVIPATVKELGNYVFLNCSNFKGAKFLCDKPTVGTMIYKGTPSTMKTVVDKKAKWWETDIAAGTWQDRPIVWATPVVDVIDAGVYWKSTLEDLGFDVPTDGTPYSVTALGLPAGLKLKYNAAVKNSKGKVTKKAKCEWWIEGVPTAGTSYAEMPPYLVITAYGKTETVPLEIEVDAQVPVDKGVFTVGDSISAEGWLDGVEGSGWTVSGLPAGLKYTAKALNKPKTPANSVYGKTTKAGLYTITAKKKKAGTAFFETLKFKVLVRPKPVDAARFGLLADRESYAYDEMAWDLTTDVAAVGGKVAKVTGLPKGLTFAAADTYGYKNAKKKTGKYLKQKGQTIVGRMTKAGTYVVTFTKNVKSGKKTVAKTAQILWTVKPSEAKPELAFNDNGGDVVECSIGLKYQGTLMPFTANATSVTASGMPKGITLVNTGTGWAFQGYATKAGTYLVTVTATVEGNTVTQRIALKVNGLQPWAMGTFSCYFTSEEDPNNPVYGGLGTVSVTSAGKVSGKFTKAGATWTFSAPCFTTSDEATFFSVPVTAKHAYKKGKKTFYDTADFVLLVTPSDVGGIVTLTGVENSAMVLHGQQNLWGSTYKKLGAKLFVSGAKNKNKFKVYTAKILYDSKEHDLTVKVTTAGKATVTLKFDTGKTKKGKKVYWTPSCSTTVWPDTLPDDTSFHGFVHYFFPHSEYMVGGYGNYCVIVEE